MKIGLVHMPNWDIRGFILEDVKDFNEYVDFASQEIEIGIRSVFNSPEPVERWDHLCTDQSMFNAMFHLSFLDCKLNGGNPLLKLDNVINSKYRSMLSTILEGTTIVVNSVGGWCPASKELGYTILEGEEHTPPLHYYIAKTNSDGGTIPNHYNETTKFIALENDPDIPNYTRIHLKELDKYYSVVKNMVHWRRQDFHKVLTEFKNAGGQGIWLYTTGMNVDQMYLYTDVAIEVGLTEFIFNFNSGKDEQIIDFINKYKDNANINFEVNFV